MNETNPYAQLGVSEDASFEEVQAARAQLLRECQGDERRAQVVEMAYDAILMDRLRQRQEGRLKVPERIRYAERHMVATAERNDVRTVTLPAWAEQLRTWIDTPTAADVAWPALVYGGLGFWAWSAPVNAALPVALGIGASLFFLNRKENRFGRAMLLTLLGLVLGAVVGTVLASLGLGLHPNVAVSWGMFLILWLVSSFLR
ncbi:MAG: CPP1-like family protein [Gloeomargarita sp. SKYBB_i_bin120]|nr:CPP1-like family protein [Gloeomargarita sp. SKYG98]MCS7292376.1 CPP1-like family protein [Gloeomargarita sp. SKYB120]MDW8177936.1 CPP1-like family protein [Gloeomargarita sp. SKYBB_i_bin120]